MSAAKSCLVFIYTYMYMQKMYNLALEALCRTSTRFMYPMLVCAPHDALYKMDLASLQHCVAYIPQFGLEGT